MTKNNKKAGAATSAANVVQRGALATAKHFKKKNKESYLKI